ncbi:hypothetical protein [Streptomyces griseorubiginosus]|uniref:hypothetical protein n=1 Tax=Streptomyces griseorubiginosus TaxID=67304 RepID=UPI00332C752A
MNPDVYAAWHNAAAWLAAHWTGLAAWGIAAAGLTVVAWALWPGSDDYRSRNDRKQADEAVASNDRPEPGQPGTDISLYLDCVAIYGDCDELDRLREAIDQHRKEMP